MSPGPARRTPDLADSDLTDRLWHLLAAGQRDDPTSFLVLLAESAEAFAETSEPRWIAWRHALAARRALVESAPEAAAADIAAAHEALETCPPSPETALAMAYLAHVEVTADRFDAAMLLAVDASLLTEPASSGEPSRALQQAHRWLALTLSSLDLEELAVGHAIRGQHVAAALREPAEQWQMRLLSAQQHTELAQTLRRRGELDRSRLLAVDAIACATSARELAWEPERAEADLLDVVQAWALTCADELDAAVGPLRRVRRRVELEGSVWLRGYTALALARLLVRLAQRDGEEESAEEGVALLVDAAGAFAAAGDRRRYRQCLLELGQNAADLGRPAEALHWLESYRADTGRAHARGRAMWADMFIRRSRLREAERQAALLRQHALEDPLTGLGNRRSAERRLGAMRLGEEPLSLAVVDVDRFKEVNDDTSHTHGDAVLRRVADLLREHSRNGDEVYRWAGDEFLVVLPTATQAQAVVVMERLRSAVAAAEWSDLIPGPVTVSIGVATAPAVGEAEAGTATVVGWRALFDTADLHLFSAKRSGRNRVQAPGGAPVDEDTEDDDIDDEGES